ncbi:MAG: sulfatase-like hydrolase/transferase [Myxococcota bacterium]
MSEQHISIKAIILAGIAPPAIQSVLLMLDDGPITVQYALIEWAIYIALTLLMAINAIRSRLNVFLIPAAFVIIGHISQIEMNIEIRGSALVTILFKAAMSLIIIWVVNIIPKLRTPFWWISWPASLFAILGCHLFYTTNLKSFAENFKPWVTPTSQSTTADPAIIVVVIDTLRADSAVQMQSWKFLEERCATWDKALSTSSWTLPSMASLWTGLYPPEHGAYADPADGKNHLPIFDGIPLLAEDLSARGYATGAVVGNAVVNQEMGFHKGIDNWIAGQEGIPMPVKLSFVGHTYANISSKAVGLSDSYVIYEQSMAWLNRQKESGYFLWSHFFDPHLPYLHSPDPADRTNIRNTVRVGFARINDEYKDKWFGLYMNEVNYTDQYFMKYLQTLEERDYFKNNIFVFTVDHGEEFWDDGGFEHAHQHSPSVVDIPIAYCSPTTQIEKRTDMASILDIHSTLKAELGMPHEGVDLREPIPDARTAFAMTNKFYVPQITARQDKNRVIRSFDSYEYKTYTDEVVSGENTPLMSLQLDEWTSLQPRLGERKPAEADADRLRSIGYVE